MIPDKTMSYRNPPCLMRPLSWLYGRVTEFRNYLYDRNFFTEKQVLLPVISIGNLAVGGTGKTPLVIHILDLLIETGHLPMVVTRGYGGRVGKQPVRVPSSGSFTVFGDEPVMIANQFPEIPIIVSRDRVKGANWGISNYEVDCIVLDDGFQHRRIARDLNIVVLDSRRPVTHDKLLPYGRLRELPGSLARADIIMFSHSAERKPASEDMEFINTRLRPNSFFLSRHKSVRFRFAGSSKEVNSDNIESPAGLISAIGSPEGFRYSVHACGILPVFEKHFPDHSRISSSDWFKTSMEAKKNGCCSLITTAKDETRLPQGISLGLPLYVLDITMEIDRHEEFARQVLMVVTNYDKV
ncbi:tetraacyldisaccharide 4'-kinase [bacterium]|nr:tetraacyldisaccharide 4'-kinase [bacterium]